MAEEPKHEEAKAEPEKKKPVGTLESIVNESAHFAKAGLNLGLAGLVPAFQGYLMPQVARDTALIAGVQMAGDATTNFKRGKKTTSGEILKSSIIGTSLAAPAHYAYQLLNKIPLDSAVGYLSKAAAWSGAVVPAFIGAYQSIDYFVRNLTFKGMGKYLKENYLSTLKKSWTRILPFSLANIFFMPAYLQILVGMAIQYFFTLFGAPKKGEIPKEQQRDKTPYLVAAPRALGRGLKSIFYGVPEAIYAIGSGIKGSLYKAAPKPAAPAAKPA